MHMKKIILFTSFILTFSLANAQLKLYSPGGVEISGDTFVFNHLIDTSVFNLDFEHKDLVLPKNESLDTMVIDVIREEISFIPGTGDYFCWGSQCFGEVAAGSRTSWKSNDTVITPPDSTAGGIGFAAYLAHKNNLGEALYKYTFIDERNSRTRASIFVKYVIESKKVFLNDDNGASIENQTILDWRGIDTLNSVDFYKFENLVNIQNISNEDIKLVLSRSERNVLAGVADSIVWGNNSYSRSTSGQNPNRRFADTLTVAANQTLTAPLKMYYFSNDQIGESQYRFSIKVIPTSTSITSTLSFDFKVGTSYITSLNEKNFNSSFTLYPNPASDQVFASFDKKYAQQNNQVVVYNIVGEKVFEHNLNIGEHNVELNTDAFDSGVYFVNILSNGELLGSKKLIVK